MSDPGRPRRRLEPEGPRRRGTGASDPWVVTIVAALVVVAGGWFLGQGLAHILGSRDRQPAPVSAPTLAPPTPTPVAATAVPSALATATPTAKPKPRPAPNKVRTPTPAPTHSASPATATPEPSPTPARTPVATTAPTPVRTATPPARTPAPKPAPPRSTPRVPAPVTGGGGASAEGVVRGYIDALRRGDPQAAAAYLGNGTPDEEFIDENTRVTSVSSTQNSDGSYRVHVTMHATKGEYSETFVVAGAAGSEKILEKTAVKP